MTRYKIAAALGALMVHGAVFAAALPDAPAPREGRGPMALFKMADANGDGAVSKAEFSAALEQHFAKMDVNKDGKLTAEDRQALRQQRIDARFGQIDADKNGQISKSEFSASADKRREAFADKAGARDDRGPGPMGGHAFGGRGFAGRGFEGQGRGAGPDADKDGTLTKAAFMARPMALFDRIDSNHDGKISADEAKAAGALRGMGRGMGGAMGRGGHDGHDMPPPPPPAQK